MMLSTGAFAKGNRPAKLLAKRYCPIAYRLLENHLANSPPYSGQCKRFLISWPLHFLDKSMRMSETDVATRTNACYRSTIINSRAAFIL